MFRQYFNFSLSKILDTDQAYSYLIVEWSRDNFQTIDGSLIIRDLQKLEAMVDKLESGQNYSVRVASGNCKGFSAFSYPSPNSAIPSS